MTIYRLQLFWPGRDQSASQYSSKLFQLFEKAKVINERLCDWQVEHPVTKLVQVCKNREICDEVIEKSRIDWKTGSKVERAYVQVFYIGSIHNPKVFLKITCGISPLPMPLWVPNRLEMEISHDGTPYSLCEPNVIGHLFRTSVELFEPEWGFVGNESIPKAPLPLESNGGACVGWMNYFSNAYPQVPAVPEPAWVQSVNGKGTLVVTHPERFEAKKESHLVALKNTAAVLKQAGFCGAAPSLVKARQK
jgi:hypothetical protein